MAKFDRFMVDVHVGTNRKLRRLTVAERWCHVAGVLAVAAQAPIRGRLLVGNDEATAADYAETAGVTLPVAKSTVKKLRDLGIIVDDNDHGCERVHDWESCNPAPKHDPTAAERMRKYREKRATEGRDPRYKTFARDGWVCVVCGSDDRLAVDHKTPVSKGGSDDPENLQTLCKGCNSSKKDLDYDAWLPKRLQALEAVRNGTSVTDRNGTSVTAGREEKRREEEAKASSSDAKRSDREREKATEEDLANCRLFAELVRGRNPKAKIPKAGGETSWLREMRLLREIDDNSPADIERAIRWVFTDQGRDADFWATTIQAPSGLREHFSKVWAKMTAQPTLQAVPVESSAAYLARRGAA